MSEFETEGDEIPAVTGRRDFLSSIGAAGGTVFLPRGIISRGAAMEVRASATIFHSHDNRVLVRFSVTGSDAPAGRLRVYDSNRGFIGTAGVLPVAGRLYGEFWIPIDGPTRISTDLELPRRVPFRSEHRLDPPRRWVVHWETAAPAAALRARLDALPPLQRAIEIRLLREQRFVINPAPEMIDGFNLLAIVAALADPLALSRDLGIELGTTAHIDTSSASPTLPVLMRGAGVARAMTRDGDRVFWLEAPGGTRLLAMGVGSSGNPEHLGFGGGPDIMAPLLERLTERYAETSWDHLLIAGDRLEDDRPALLGSVEEWNGRYAFPRIEVVTGTWEVPNETGPIPVLPLHPRETPVPDAEHLREAASTRVSVTEAGIERLLAAAAMAVAAPGRRIANAFSLPVPGHLVFNGSPYTRSDVARLPDGEEFLATSIPPTGYAYFPGSQHARVGTTDSDLTASNGTVTVAIDSASGAIASVRDTNGIEWVARGTAGWNSLARSRLESARRETLPGLGVRFRLDRWSTSRGYLTTVITLYDGLPWIDVSNSCEGVGLGAIEYAFPVAISDPMVTWDLTVDSVSARAPVGPMIHDRFVALSGPDRAAYFRCYESPHFSVGAAGVLTAYAPRGVCRFRLAAISDERFDDDPQRFGWSADPFTVVATPGTGTIVTDTFGSFLSTDRNDVTIVGVKPATDSRGLIVYLQNQSSFEREVRVRSGLVAFESGNQCDLLERELPDSTGAGSDGIPATVESRSLAAVRLLGLHPGSP